MSMIQIRNVPDDLHRALKVRAAKEGVTLSELILRELPRIAHSPSIEEIYARIKSREPVPEHPPAADIIRAGREERDARR